MLEVVALGRVEGVHRGVDDGAGEGEVAAGSGVCVEMGFFFVGIDRVFCCKARSAGCNVNFGDMILDIHMNNAYPVLFQDPFSRTCWSGCRGSFAIVDDYEHLL